MSRSVHVKVKDAASLKQRVHVKHKDCDCDEAKLRIFLTVEVCISRYLS